MSSSKKSFTKDPSQWPITPTEVVRAIGHPIQLNADGIIQLSPKSKTRIGKAIRASRLHANVRPVARAQDPTEKKKAERKAKARAAFDSIQARIAAEERQAHAEAEERTRQRSERAKRAHDARVMAECQRQVQSRGTGPIRKVRWRLRPDSDDEEDSPVIPAIPVIPLTPVPVPSDVGNSYWLTLDRPPELPELKDHHRCDICLGPKSHPVSYTCGHSHCYVCIRAWLDKRGDCPLCRQTCFSTTTVPPRHTLFPLVPLILWRLQLRLLPIQVSSPPRFSRPPEIMAKDQSIPTKTAATKLALRQASAKYREKYGFELLLQVYEALPLPRNLEELREKARERMEKHREKISEAPELLEAQRARAREASRKYRASHADTLAHRQRIRRMSAFEKKHGHKAWADRCEKLERQRREAAEEEMRKYAEEFRRREREWAGCKDAA
ncbi:hypothetical protein FB45DRAFT_1027397 [Roridomyces roridus]|uniref:RING-type E3 ubiquitin transferase n=1 Tax=Roridomyces roridus TaxID=1738132 RepID=A0AAD7BT60_9AGAR|nr:hypothetical protein FB45DRAFT_1027397 [Roridomyces roridus]